MNHNYWDCLMRLLALCFSMLLSAPVWSQDAVIFRNRGETGQQTIKGKIDGESLGGIQIAGKTIAAADVVDVQYEIPGSIKLDLPKAIQAEAAGKYEEAVREYRALLNVPAVGNNKSLKRYFEYKVAWLTAAPTENGSDGLRNAIDALTKFIQNHPDTWQRVSAARQLARLHLDSTSPSFDAARKVLNELAQATGSPSELKAECTFAVFDLWMRQKNMDQARRVLASAPANDPRTAIYQTLVTADPANIDAIIKKLEQQRDQAEDGLKPAIHNALGDCYRLDAKRLKDALFAYLWVDVVYNFDPVETAKAQDRLAELFHEMKDDERAKMYRNKARGR